MQLDSEDQHRRAIAFRELHGGPAPFVIPNPPDAGSARLLAGLGFPALATTSAGLAFSLGRPDGAGAVRRAEALANARAIVAATPLPVSADLENCYGETADGIAETIRLAAEAGLVGGSIEDTTADPDEPIFPFDVAVERVRAAVAAARRLPFPFTLTARADNFFCGRADLDDTIARLRAYEAAGADVLYAPGLPSLNAIRAVCRAVTGPVNVLAGPAYSLGQLRECGARRISLGSGLARAALTALRRAAQEITAEQTFGFLADALPYPDVNALMRDDLPGRGSLG